MAAGMKNVTITVNFDFSPLIATLDAFIASLTDMRDRLEAEQAELEKNE